MQCYLASARDSAVQMHQLMAVCIGGLPAAASHPLLHDHQQNCAGCRSCSHMMHTCRTDHKHKHPTNAHCMYTLPPSVLFLCLHCMQRPNKRRRVQLTLANVTAHPQYPPIKANHGARPNLSPATKKKQLQLQQTLGQAT